MQIAMSTKLVTILLFLGVSLTGMVKGQSTAKTSKPNYNGKPFSGKTTAYYTFSHLTSPYLPLVEPNSLNAGNVWDDPEYHLAIGFPFTFFDQTWDSVYVVDYLAFEPNLFYWIDPIYTDWIDRGYDSTTQSNIGWALEGTAPNRVLKIEWRNAGYYCEYDSYAATPDSASAQAWLFETSNRIEIHIGACSTDSYPTPYCGNPGPQVGVWQDDGVIHESLYLTGDPSNPDTVINNAAYDSFLDTTAASGNVYVFDFAAPASTIGEIPVGVSVYPKPIEDRCHLSLPFSTGAEIQMTDAVGKVWKVFALESGGTEYELEFPAIPGGIYFLQIHQGARTYIEKIVKI
jgi:hypothetical protein